MFPILHQYEVSPFSEKIRRILAFKQIEFHSVRVPAVMPKPDLVALTGGYRRVPVLQMGQHVYCDTALIARVLERIQPEPTLYPTPLAEIVAEWADKQLFGAVAPLALRPSRFETLTTSLTQDELTRLGEDRAAMTAGDSRAHFVAPRLGRTYVQVYLARLDALLAKNDFLCGGAPCIADFSAYHSAWFLQNVLPEPLEPFKKLHGWMSRIAALPLPPSTTITSEDALEICRRAAHREGPISGYFESVQPAREPDDTQDAEPVLGQRVVVRATDYGRDPIEGSLFSWNDHEIELERSDLRAGTVFVHFPRLGYEVRRA